MSQVKTHVVTLEGKEEFDKFVKENKCTLVDFSTDWCHWCKVLEPEYKAAAEVLHNEQAETKLVYVDGDKEKNSDLLKRYKVQGFPTIMYFQNGDLENPQEYSGGRQKADIVSWCKKRAAPAVSPIENSEAFSNFVKTDPSERKIAVVVWRKGDATKDNMLKAIYALADKHRDDFSVGHVTDDAVAKEGGLSSPLTVFRNFDSPIVALNLKDLDTATEEEILALINAEKLPLVGEINRANANEYLISPFSLVWIAEKLGKDELDEKSVDKKSQLINLFKPLAEKYKGQLLFVLLDVNLFPGQAENMGMKGVPALMIQKDESKYLFRGDFNNANSLAEFFDAWKHGKLPMFRKTEEPPETQDPEGVFVLVGSTFEDHVGTKDKDVFVDFYADWCLPCQKLVPIYKELAKKFKNVPGLMIAKINADQNDTFQKIESYPTLLFFKKGSREGIKYQGDRSLNSFIEFVKTNATVDCSSVTV